MHPARLEVGRVARAHGLRGEVVVVPVSNRPERFRPGGRLWLDGEPVSIRDVRPHGRAYLVAFEGVDDRTAAERLRGKVLTAEPPGPPPAGELWVHEIIGAEVRDRSGRSLGRVTAVEANPAHDLLVLDGGALVPMVFVVEHSGDVVVVDVPEGLLEL